MKALAPLALLVSLLGCMTSSSGTGVAGSQGGCKGVGCAHSSVGSRAGSSSSGGSSSGSSGGSTFSGGSSTSSAGTTGTSSGSSSGVAGASSGSSGSSSGGLFTCGGSPLPDAGACAGGSFVSQLVDAFSCAPIAAATVQALDANGVPVTGAVTSATDGTFVLCGPVGSFSPFLSAPGYATSYRAEIEAGSDLSLTSTSMYSNDIVNAITALAPGGYDRSLGALIALIGASSNCPDRAGFTLSLTDGDGGPLADGGFREVYLGTSALPDPTLASTSAEGLALFYDIDTSTTSFFAVSWSNPDAGACGPVLQTATAWLTGRVFVTGNALSNDILIRP